MPQANEKPLYVGLYRSGPGQDAPDLNAGFCTVEPIESVDPAALS